MGFQQNFFQQRLSFLALRHAMTHVRIRIGKGVNISDNYRRRFNKSYNKKNLKSEKNMLKILLKSVYLRR